MAAENLLFQESIQMDKEKTITMESRCGTKPIKLSDTMSISNVDGTFGPSVFTKLIKQWAGTSEAQFGITLPLAVCADKCSGDKMKGR